MRSSKKKSKTETAKTPAKEQVPKKTTEEEGGVRSSERAATPTTKTTPTTPTAKTTPTTPRTKTTPTSPRTKTTPTSPKTTSKSKRRSTASSKKLLGCTIQKVSWLLIVVIALIVIAALITLCYYLYRKYKEPTNTGSTECDCICDRPDLMTPHPPLIVISLDGYAKKYLSRKLQPTFEKMARCGVSAQAVYSGFPSMTFPNHYTMATGFHPGNHEIVHNTIYDPSVHPKTNYLGKKPLDGYFKKEPIWSYYKRFWKRKAAAYSWMGAQHNSTLYLQPDYLIQFNPDMTPGEQLMQIVKWLRMDEPDRPGLIMVYIMEPDFTGHRTMGPMLSKVLSHLDQHLDLLMQTLKEDGILCCVNLVVISDHGMAAIKNAVVLERYFNLKGMTIISGALAHIFKGNSTLSDKEITKRLTCKGTDRVRVFTKLTMPLRLHYSNSKRIGDLVLVSKKDTRIVSTQKGLKRRTKPNQHGVDYIDTDMQTIMFAQGPSFRKNVSLPPFHMVEYMNLWKKLLKLPSMKNDGVNAFMDLALNTRQRQQKHKRVDYPEIRACALPELSSTKTPNRRMCGKCLSQDEEVLKNWNSCTARGLSGTIILHSETEHLCKLSFCKDMVIIESSTKEVFSTTLFEIYNKDGDEQLLSNDCTYHMIKKSGTCGQFSTTKNMRLETLSAFPGRVLANERGLFVPWKRRFSKEILKPLNEYTRRIVTKLGRVISITGTAYDHDYNGKHSVDSSKTHYPTHLFRMLLTCRREWSDDGTYCKQASDTKVLSFVLPHMDGDINCMSEYELLLQYTATVKEVETVSGLFFNFTKIPELDQMLLKMHISATLW
ncbi:hypothetical protein RB195_012398 [Necator americanus]|uniref:Type I phosphodiesterase / nucleotide pyrophosphatase n=1 Tax=Necator americanus TaxID=51031 RepID=A0ABR1D708_NECAM